MLCVFLKKIHVIVTQVWTEAAESVGAVNFVTGAGGFLQALIFGYAGLRVYPYYLEFKSTPLPPGASAITLVGLDYLGARLDVTMDEVDITFTCYGEADRDLHLQFDSGPVFPLICGSEGEICDDFPYLLTRKTLKNPKLKLCCFSRCLLRPCCFSLCFFRLDPTNYFFGIFYCIILFILEVGK